jgi:CHAT domain-containing protein/tetratricopeptide (TPR) repeat protein
VFKSGLTRRAVALTEAVGTTSQVGVYVTELRIYQDLTELLIELLSGRLKNRLCGEDRRMPNSLADISNVICPKCSTVFSATIWKVLDTTEHPALAGPVQRRRLHHFTCPSGHGIELDLPLLIYLPGRSPRLMFSPAKGATAKQAAAHAESLLEQLAHRLGSVWDDTWTKDRIDSVLREELHRILDEMLFIPREILSRQRNAEQFTERYRKTQNIHALEQAIDAWNSVIAHLGSTAVPDWFKLRMLNALGIAYSDRFHIRGHQSDLDLALKCFRQCVNLEPEGLPELPKCYNNLGDGLRERYTLSGNAHDLQAAVSACMKAVALVPKDAAERAGMLHNLGFGLAERYNHTGNVKDLNAAIAAHRQAAKLTPADAPSFSKYLTGLGLALRQKYLRSGSRDDLEEAIAVLRRAVTLARAESPDRAGFLTNLGIGLAERFLATGEVTDLEGAVGHYEESVRLTARQSPELAPRLNNLGMGLIERYAHSNGPKDLGRAIRAYRDAISLTPPGSTDLPSRLHNLGNALTERYANTRKVRDLRAAITLYQSAADAVPKTSSNRSIYLNSLGAAFLEVYTRTNSLMDLETAIRAIQQAVDATPQGSPLLPMYLGNVGLGLRHRHSRTERDNDLQAAIAAFRRACAAGLDLAPQESLRSSSIWGAWAMTRNSWEEAAEAYGLGLQAIEQLLSTQLLRSSKESWLRRAQEIPNCAAYALARSGELVGAVLALEQGRARLLTEAMEQTRSDLDRLPMLGYGKVYRRYRDVAARIELLERAELRNERSLDDADLSAEIHLARRELEAAIKAVRDIPGYQDFLCTPDIETIRQCLTNCIGEHPGPIAGVYLIITRAGGLGLVIHSGGVQPLPLKFNENDLNNVLIKRKRKAITGGYLPAQLGGAPRQEVLDEVLPKLGKHIMQPLAAVLDALVPASQPTPNTVARLLVLIPTGRLALLPLHAAQYGIKGKERAFLDDFTVAYVPSARVLDHCRQTLRSQSTGQPSLVAIGNPLPSEARALVFGRAEAEEISMLFEGRSEQFCEVDAKHFDPKTSMRSASYIHFACHGSYDPESPLKSAVILAGGKRLTLADVYAQPPLRETRLVVLSACQTGVVDFDKLPEEAIGLPGGFLQAGAPGVVGTLWSVDDLSTALLMAKFYSLHLRGDPTTDEGPMPPVRALQRAQRWLRDATAEELDLVERWAQVHRTTVDPVLRKVAFNRMRYHARHPHEPPFAHPHHWAAFTLAGV